MTTLSLSRLSFFLAAFVAAAQAEQAAAKTTPVVFEKQVVPLLNKYCYECHGDGANKGNIALDDFKTVDDVRKSRKPWESALRVVTRHEMPPADATEFPTDTERETIAQFIERELFKIDPAHPDPGRVTLRRLNRAEYTNAVRDLVGFEFNALADFPPDDSGYGFDNIGDVLSLPPVLMEKYLAAADKILDQAIVTEPIKSQTIRVPASLAKIGFNAIGDRGDGWVHLISLEEDDLTVELPIVAAGDYIVRFQAYATKTGGAVVGQGSEKPIEFKEDPGPTRMALALNDAFVRSFELTTDEKTPGIYEARIGVPAGVQNFRAVMRRNRYGADELTMLNGRLGRQQPGAGFVKWMEIEGPLHTATRRYRPDQAQVTGVGSFMQDGARVLDQNGEVIVPIVAKQDGEFILRAQAYAYQAGDEPTRMEFRIDGKPVKTFDVLAPGNMQPIKGQRVFSTMLLVPQPELYEHRLKLPPGEHKFSAAFINDFSDAENANPNLRDRRLILQSLEVADLSAPVIDPPKPAPVQALFAEQKGQQNEAAARTIVKTFAYRAWHRPVENAELDLLMKLYALARAQGDGFDAAVKLAMKATLVSPHFLFLGEAASSTPAPARTVAVASTTAPQGVDFTVKPVSEFALAARLSFFLWSSVPDDELLRLAEKGQLHANYDAQVRRMLSSPKARALVDNFAGQWLQIRSLETMQPDKKLFPDFDPTLRFAMQRETELFFEHVLREDRNVFDFLRGDYTFLNARLAKFYGITGVAGDEFRQVSLAGTPRRGVLTQASVLTLTSNPTRTSPVKRGKWVLENLLGTPPPPPPPDVPQLEEDKGKMVGTLRQQMEQHRANPACASCHARMDPIGFGLENFDAIGAWREKDGEAMIDAGGELAGGDKFGNASELSEILAMKRADEFRRCLAEKMLTYALGRGVEYFDRPAVQQIVSDLRTGEDHFSSLILAVAKSFPFQNQRVSNPTTASVTSNDQ